MVAHLLAVQAASCVDRWQHTLFSFALLLHVPPVPHSFLLLMCLPCRMKSYSSVSVSRTLHSFWLCPLYCQYSIIISLVGVMHG